MDNDSPGCGCECIGVGSFAVRMGVMSSFVFRPRFFGVVDILLCAAWNCAVYIDGGISGIVSCAADIGNGDIKDGGICGGIITLEPVSIVSFVGESSFFIGSVNASFSLRFRMVSPANFNCCCANSSSSIILAIASSSMSSGSKSSGKSSSKPFESLSLAVLFRMADFLRSTSSALAL